MWYDKLIEQDQVPDLLLRKGIRRLLRQRLRDENKGDVALQQAHLMELISKLKASPIAVNTADANQQHYEVPTRFYQYCLGKNLKYSSGYWKPGVTDINVSEMICWTLPASAPNLKMDKRFWNWAAAGVRCRCIWLRNTPEALSQWYPTRARKKHILMSKPPNAGYTNLTVITADMNTFHIDEQFDRVVSVEMFEHMRNYQLLMKKVASFLKPDGKL